jgi:hypothetical protein
MPDPSAETSAHKRTARIIETREAMLSLMESYVDVVLELDDSTIAGLRREGQRPR